jgi:uncharacterized protein YciI
MRAIPTDKVNNSTGHKGASSAHSGTLDRLPTAGVHRRQTRGPQMTDQPAPAHSLETVWMVQATYAPDAAETRVPLRGRHLARIATLKAAGTIVIAGAYTDMTASMLLVRAEDEAAALEIVRGDIYMQHGVWVELRAKPFVHVVLDPVG